MRGIIHSRHVAFFVSKLPPSFSAQTSGTTSKPVTFWSQLLAIADLAVNFLVFCGIVSSCVVQHLTTQTCTYTKYALNACSLHSSCCCNVLSISRMLLTIFLLGLYNYTLYYLFTVIPYTISLTNK